MKLLVVMYGINGGGAEKSLVSFLTTLEMKYGNDIDVDLLLFRPERVFLFTLIFFILWLRILRWRIFTGRSRRVNSVRS